MISKKLKKAVLQAAFQGELTNQDKSQNAGVILNKIHEKNNSKKNLNTVNNLDDELFDIPENWAWTKLSEVSDYGQGRQVKKEKIDKGSLIIELADIEKETNRLINKTYDRVAGSSKNVFGKNDILYGKLRPYLKKCIVAEEDGYCSTEIVPFKVEPGVEAKFIMYYMISPMLDKYVNSLTHGMDMPRLGTKKAQNLPVPLAPTEEQRRIVEKLEEILPMIYELEFLEMRQNKLMGEFPDKMKDSILNDAIQGKLSNQNITDESAHDLIKGNCDLRDRMLENNRTKKQKRLDEIENWEIPFELPKNWEWVRLGEYVEKVTDYVASGSFQSLKENCPSLKSEDYAILVKTADFSNNFSKNLTYTSKQGYEFLHNSNLFGGELILSNIGSIGKVFIVPKLEKPMTLAPNSIMVKCFTKEEIPYLYYFFKSPLALRQLLNISSGTTMKKFNKTMLKTILVPIPPIDEQKRIVKKLESLLPLLDNLSANY